MGESTFDKKEEIQIKTKNHYERNPLFNRCLRGFDQSLKIKKQ